MTLCNTIGERQGKSGQKQEGIFVGQKEAQRSIAKVHNLLIRFFMSLILWEKIIFVAGCIGHIFLL